MNKERYESSAKLSYYGWIGIIITLLFLVLTSCHGTYYISDAEYSDSHEEHVPLTYHNGNPYFGLHGGYYWYYGKPHYAPWYDYYNTCPPSYYNKSTHVVIKRPVKRPLQKPIIIRVPKGSKQSFNWAKQRKVKNKR